MTTPDGLQPPGNMTEYGSWGEVQARTEEDWSAQENQKWNSAFKPVQDNNFPTWLARLLDAFKGNYSGSDPLFLDFDSWSNQLIQDFQDIGDAFEGNYTGSDPALTFIQNTIGSMHLDIGGNENGIQKVIDLIDNVWTGQPTTNNPFSAITNALEGIFGRAKSAQYTGVDNSIAIAEIKTQLAGDSSGGGSGTGTTFLESFNAGLANWSVQNPSNVVLSTDGGEVHTTNAGATGHVWLIHNNPMPGDNFDYTVVIGSELRNDITDSGLLFRVNSDCTNFGYVNFYKKKLYIGWGSKASASATTYTPHDWLPEVAADLSVGKRLRITGVGNRFRVYVNDAIVVDYTDSGNTKPSGAAYRRNALRVECRYVNLGKYSGPAIASFSAADLTVPTYGGVGWNMSRVSTSATSNIGTSTNGVVLPSGIFTVESNPGVTVLDTTGLIQIKQTGWYSISLSLELNSAQNNSGCGLWQGATTGAMSVIRFGGDHSGIYPGPRHQGSWQVYCRAGEYVRPVVQLGASTGIIGDVNGAKTFFSGVLVQAVGE